MPSSVIPWFQADLWLATTARPKVYARHKHTGRNLHCLGEICVTHTCKQGNSCIQVCKYSSHASDRRYPRTCTGSVHLMRGNPCLAWCLRFARQNARVRGQHTSCTLGKGVGVWQCPAMRVSPWPAEFEQWFTSKTTSKFPPASALTMATRKPTCHQPARSPNAPSHSGRMPTGRSSRPWP